MTAIETAWFGVPAPRAIVLLHEGLGSVSHWRGVPAELARLTDLPVLAYSRAGYGASDPIVPPRPLSYMHDEARALPALLAAEGIDEPILVGHSDGASIAIIAAGSGVVRPRALVLIAPHVFVEDVSIASIAIARDTYPTFRARLAKYHADVDGAFWGWNRAWLDPAFRQWNIEAFVPAITAPTLIVQGDADEYGTLAQVEALAALGGPREVEIVRGAGHAPHRDPAVLARIAAFVVRAI